MRKKSMKRKAKVSKKPEKEFQLIEDRPPRIAYERGTFDALPVAMMRLIQGYLSQYDYRQLLATNVEIFQSIRYETIYYQLRGVEWEHSEYGTIPERIQFLQRLTGTVKDKSSQVGLKLGFHSYRTIANNYRSIISGIHKVQICGRLPSTRRYPIKPIDFAQVFRNVSHIILTQLHELTSIEGLEGVRTLEINYCDRLKKIGKVTPTLTKLKIARLPMLETVEDLCDINHVIMDTCPLLCLPVSPERHRGKIVEISEFRMSNIIDWTYFEHIERLVIRHGLFSPKTNLDCLRHIPSLTVVRNAVIFSHRAADGLIKGTYHCKYLSLMLYDMLTEGEVFPNLEEISLSNCMIADLNTFQTASRVKLVRCSFTTEILRFSNCYRNLQEVHLESITGRIDLLSLAQVRRLTLENCPTITDVSSLGSIHSLKISDCQNLQSLAGLGKGNHSVSIYRCPMADFSPLDSVYEVELLGCKHLESATAFKHAKIVSFSGCSSLRDVSMLGEVQSLKLRYCSEISTLQGLANVPFIEVVHCSRLRSVKGLGNNNWIKITSLEKFDESPEELKELLHAVNYVRFNGNI